jgi:hypothetical protein
VVEVQRIWGRAPHNSDSDLLRFKGRWYCAFREAPSAESTHGTVRVLSSADGERWQSAAHFTLAESDLRDPGLSVTPDRRLMLTAVAIPDRAGSACQSLAWFSSDGRDWASQVEAGTPGMWLGSTIWRNGRAYNLGYGGDGRRMARIYTGVDGLQYGTLVTDLAGHGDPAEGSLLFLSDDTALCVLRREYKEAHTMLGRARPPYRAWTWKDLGFQLAEPRALDLPDGRFIVAGRMTDGKPRTALCWLDAEAGTLKEFLALPSSGEAGSPGLAFHDGLLWVSYASAHEGKPGIYVTRVKL